jgi:hypothetical protein
MLGIAAELFRLTYILILKIRKKEIDPSSSKAT